MSNIASPGSGSLELIKRIEELETSNEFSLEEKRIGTWIDGKPLYRKVIKDETVYSNSETLQTYNIQHGIQNIDTVVGYSAIMTSKFYNTTYTLPYFYPGDGLMHTNAEQVTKDFIRFRNRTSWLNYNMFVVIEYTKTTD